MPPRINIPPITRILLLTLVAQSLLSFGIRYRTWTKESDLVVPYISLVPQLSILYPWTFFLTTFSENNIFTLLISALTLFYGGRYLERAWTSKEFAKFLVIASLLPNLLTLGTLVALYYLTGNMTWTLTTINGTIALQVSFLVAFSQLVPSHTVTLFKGILSLRVPRFPLLHVLAVMLLSLTPLLTAASFFLVFYGFIVSWTHLRFYKAAFPDLDSNQSSTLRGDASESFAFAEFFPEAVKPSVARFSGSVYNLLVAVGICTPFSAADVSASRGENGYIAQQRNAPGGARAEAERRRTLALRALDQRLQAATAKTPQPPAQSQEPPVQEQPQPSGETMLGETNFNPEAEKEDH